MRLQADIVGSVVQALREFRVEKSVRVRALTDRHTERLKQRLRQDVQAAGMGRRLANTWQSKVYPASSRPTLSPAGYVYSRAPLIINAFSTGATIVNKSGGWLAIPTGAAPRKGGRGGGKRMGPVEVEAHFNQELRVVQPRGSAGRYAFLVMDNVTRARGKAGERGRYRKFTKGRARQGRTAESVVMFVLVPQVRLKKLFDLEARTRRVADDLASDLRNELS